MVPVLVAFIIICIALPSLPQHQNYLADDYADEDDVDDNADDGDHDDDDIQVTHKDGVDEILLQAIASMKTRTTRRSNCTLVPVLLGRFLLLFDTIW